VGVAWPKPLWHAEDAHRSEGLPGELADALAEAKKLGRGLKLRLFQREPDPPRERVELVAAGHGVALRLAEVPLGELSDRVRRIARGETPLGAAPLDPEILVCTDGKHDRCCAEYGFALYRALRSEAARRGSRVRVAESSHLGGHRFAANCLLLPSLALYGRLDPAHAGALLDAAADVVPSLLRAHLRGRLGTEELIQVADAWLAETHPELPLECATVMDADDERAHVEVRAGTARFELRCRSREFLGPSSCGEPAETRRRWIAEGPG
jgi:hypothetical protein